MSSASPLTHTRPSCGTLDSKSHLTSESTYRKILFVPPIISFQSTVSSYFFFSLVKTVSSYFLIITVSSYLLRLYCKNVILYYYIYTYYIYIYIYIFVRILNPSFLLLSLSYTHIIIASVSHMAQDHEVVHHQNMPLMNPNHRRPARHRVVIRHRKPPAIRLGGKRPRRVTRLLRAFRKIRPRLLKLHYLCLLRTAREYYRKTVKEMKAASSAVEAFQQRVLMETSLAIPVMGVSFTTYPNMAASDRLRPFSMQNWPLSSISSSSK